MFLLCGQTTPFCPLRLGALRNKNMFVCMCRLRLAHPWQFKTQAMPVGQLTNQVTAGTPCDVKQSHAFLCWADSSAWPTGSAVGGRSSTYRSGLLRAPPETRDKAPTPQDGYFFHPPKGWIMEDEQALKDIEVGSPRAGVSSGRGLRSIGGSWP